MNYSSVSGHLKQCKNEKRLVKWRSSQITKNWEKISLNSPCLLLCAATTSSLGCHMEQKVGCIWRPAMTSSMAGLRSSKALSKAKLAFWKRFWLPSGVFYYLYYRFLSHRKRVTSEKCAQQAEMHQKLQCQKAAPAKERPNSSGNVFSMTTVHNQCFLTKAYTKRLRSSALSIYSPDFLPASRCLDNH